MEHQTFELGGFCLQHSQARLNILVQTTLDVPQGSNTISLDSAVKYWVQRARRLTFRVELEAPHLNQEQLITLIEILANAEIWCQLGLLVSWNRAQSEFSTNHCLIALDLTSNIEHETRAEKGPHALCFRTPAADVKPPSGVDILLMQSVTLLLKIQWKSSTSKRTRSSNQSAQQTASKIVEAADSNQQLLWDDPCRCSPNELNLDSGYHSVLSSQSNQDNDMMMDGQSYIEDDYADDHMLLDVRRPLTLLDEIDLLDNDNTSNLSEGALFLDHGPRVECLQQDVQGREENCTILDDGENAPSDYENWFDDEDITSTFDPLDCGIFGHSDSFDFVGKDSRAVFQNDMPAADLHSHDHKQSALPVRTQKRTTSNAFNDTNGSPNDNAFKATDLLSNLVIVAVRVAICGKPGRPGIGIKVISDTMPRKLQQIAPALWTPRYHQAVATRAALIPTICHALFESFHKNSVSAELKESFGKIGDGQEKVLWEVVRRGLDREKKL